MNNDLISRSALKKVISEYIDEYSDLDNEGNHCEKWCAMKEAEMAIDNAPTVELDETVIQEVLNKRCMTAVANEYLIALHGKADRQGEWIRHISCIECSVCKEKFFSADEDENCQDYDPCSDYNFNYCPNCGAKMITASEVTT